MRKILFFVIVCTLSSFSNANEKLAGTQESGGFCESYAQYLGSKVEEYGGNYYEGYFVGYAECIDKLGLEGL